MVPLARRSTPMGAPYSHTHTRELGGAKMDHLIVDQKQMQEWDEIGAVVGEVPTERPVRTSKSTPVRSGKPRYRQPWDSDEDVLRAIDETDSFLDILARLRTNYRTGLMGRLKKFEDAGLVSIERSTAHRGVRVRVHLTDEGRAAL